MRADGLIGLHNNPAVNRMVEFAEVANTLASDVGMLAHSYEHLVRVAPSPPGRLRPAAGRKPRASVITGPRLLARCSQ